MGERKILGQESRGKKNERKQKRTGRQRLTA
jgi:hypothetical protein